MSRRHQPKRSSKFLKNYSVDERDSEDDSVCEISNDSDEGIPRKRKSRGKQKNADERLTNSRNRSSKSPNSNKSGVEDDEISYDNDSNESEDQKRRKISHKTAEKKRKSSRNHKKIIELIDTDDDQDDEQIAQNSEGQEEKSEDEYQEKPSPKPYSGMLKKSWKTVDSTTPPTKPTNAFEKFGFIATDKNTVLSQMAASMPKSDSTPSKEKKPSRDIDEDDSENKGGSAKRRRGRPKKTSDSLTSLRTNDKVSSRVRSRPEREISKTITYAELSSGDEDVLISEEERPVKQRRSRRNDSPPLEDSKVIESEITKKGRRPRSESHKTSEVKDEKEKATNEEDSADSNDAASDDFQYRIEHVLGTKKLTAEEWRKICDNMTTREITKGSVLQQPPEEYYSNSPELVEKFLIKWSHCSYLHVSWETRSDLESLCGKSAKVTLNRFFLHQLRGVATIFDDLRSDEYFPPNVLMIDRVLDVHDETVDIQTINWQSAILPKNPYIESEDGPDKENSSVVYLHGNNSFLTVKWENLPYCDCTFEDINDLRKHGVEYEACLRDFYRREQLPPTQNSRRIIKRKIEPSVMQEPPSFTAGELRDYQWDGVRWLLYNWSNKRNSILADEMGLGKTIQTAAFFQMLSEHQGLRGPFLVVAPLSTLVNWQRELSAWTNLDCIIYQGSLEDRKIIREHEFYYMTRPKTDGYKIQIVVTSPEGCLALDDNRNSRILSKIHWDMLVIDEAHKIKNHASKISSALREDFSYSNCLLLTGTPLQNNTEELWTLLHFIEPVQFESREAFLAQFGDLKEVSQLEQLHQRISPYLLRRVKENVEKSVPPKEEIIIEVELTVPQKQYYRALYERNKAFLFRNGSLKDGPRLTNLAMELRKCCNHPYLVRGAEAELKLYFADQSKNVDVLTAPTPYQHDLLYALVQSSGKFVLLDKLLPKLAADGHRVLIFSQFRIMLDILEDYLHLRRFTYDRIDGSITGRKRQAAIDKFCQPNSPIFIMLLSTRAGGVGINLTPADTVIIYDSDWNPQNDIQAQARAHRIGQTKSVKVYRLLTKKSYEMRMFEIASKKLGLDYAVMHNMKGAHQSQAKINATNLALSSKEVELLLRQGAYDIFREEKDGSGDLESRRFCEEDIDQILSRSTVIVHDDSHQGQHPTNNFSKASFIQTGSQCNVDVNDPDFWSKVVGLSFVEENEENTRHRKCKTLVTNYLKDKVDDDNSSDSDQNFTPTEEEETILKTKKTKLKKTDMNVQLPAEWNRLNLMTLLNALVLCGYFNWERIKSFSKLPYSLADIASGCRMLILSLFRMSCMSDDTSIPVDSPAIALKKLNESKFFRFVFLAYRREIRRKNDPPLNSSVEDEILDEYYHNSAKRPQDQYMVTPTSQWSLDSDFHEILQLSHTLPLDPEFYKVLMSDIKTRNSLKSKLSQIEDHFEIAHAIKLEEINQRSMLSNALNDDNATRRYSGFDPTQTTLVEFLSAKLTIEDSPAEWWVTGLDDYLMMKEIAQFGYPHNQPRISLLETFMMKQNPGPMHREKVSNDVEFLIGGSGYTGKSIGATDAGLEHLEKGEVHRRLKDIICLLRDQELTIHFSGYLIKAMALYGWPNETIDMLSQKYQQQDPEARAQLLRPEYLPNWSDLAKITGCKIVRKKKLIECSNSLSSLSSTCKTTVSCLTKSNWVNTVKVFLALHDDESILRIFDAPTGLTYGTSCPTAPIWWTPAHDLKFLKLVVKYGTVWKTILEVAEAGEFPHSLLQPDPTFAMPADTSIHPKKALSSGLTFAKSSPATGNGYPLPSLSPHRIIGPTSSVSVKDEDSVATPSSTELKSKAKTFPSKSNSSTKQIREKEIFDLTDSTRDSPSSIPPLISSQSVHHTPSPGVKSSNTSSSSNSKPSPAAGRSIMSFFRKSSA